MVQPFPRGLSITAVAAKDLAKRKRFGAQDPYLAFYIQGRRKFTRVAVKGGIKPVWNQTIKYNQIHDRPTTEETTLTVYCIHEKTGVKVGSGDGLIGKCEIDLKQTLFQNDQGLHEGWFQLMYDGKESGQVHLRLQLCEPSTQEDTAEDAPLRFDSKNRLIKTKADKKDKKDKNGKTLTNTASTAATSASALTASATAGAAPNGVQRTPTNRLHRPRSMADLHERQPTIKFQEPIHQQRLGSRSLEEVRDLAHTPTGHSTDGDSADEEAMSSPRQTFTLQDSEGNINPLNLLIAPFDPNWLEPTPPILRRALSAQYYYDDLQTQMNTNPRDIFPRPQSQQGHLGFPSEPVFAPQGQPHHQNHQSFNSFAQHSQGASTQSAPTRPQRPLPMQMPMPDTHLPPKHHPLGPAPLTNNIHNAGNPMPTMPQGPSQTQLPTPPPNHPWVPPQSTLNYQPHTVFQPRQPGQGRSKAVDMAGNSKHMSLPSRYQLPASQMAHLQEIQRSSTMGGMVGSSSSVQQQQQQQVQQPSAPPVHQGTTALGPAAGYLPESYSQEHQRALSNHLPQSAPPQPTTTTSGPSHPPAKDSKQQSGYRMPGALPEMERPETRQCMYPTTNQPSSSMYFASPTPQQGTFPQLHQAQASTSTQGTSYNHRHTSSLSEMESFSTMQKSPAIPIPAKIPVKARDMIFGQFAPRAVPWDGRDIQESLMDPSLGRRILSRYAVGMVREKYVREGLYIKEKSPSFADSQTVQQQQQHQARLQGIASQHPPQHRPPQRQFSMDKEGNDRVILKYLKTRREWEIDCVMTRYLTCHHPEEKLESQYMDYAQSIQQSVEVNPYIVGLYETFMHPHGTDLDGCRYLSVMQWYPETLQGYIGDSIASGEGLEVTLPIVRSLIECVEWIHSRKVCHLNIKPSNFVRDPYATACLSAGGSGTGWKLIDFEAARVMDEEVVGRCTFSYAAPEILVGNSMSVGVMAKGSLDIWSLALVIYELLTDQPLFHTDDQAKETLLPASRSIKPIRFYDQVHIGPEYHPLLDSMLLQDPERRLTASQLLKLDLFTKPISARPVPQHKMIQNNNIQSLRDLKATRLCNLKGGGAAEMMEQSNGNGSAGGGSSNGSADSLYGSASQQLMMLEGVGRILDSPFDQIPRLFMLLPPLTQDLDPTRPFQASNILQNKSLRLVLLCEGLSGYGEDAHVTDHHGYVLKDVGGFIQDLGKILLHLVSVAGTNNPGYETPGLDRPLTLTGTPLDSCQRWYPSLRSYYEILQTALSRQIGPGPSLNELRLLRGPTLKLLEQWLVKIVRQQLQQPLPLNGSLPRKPSAVAQSDTMSHAGLPLGGSGYDDLSDHFESAASFEMEVPEVTGPGGGEGYGGLFKMPVGTCGDRWICRGCVSRQRAMTAAAATRGR